MYTERNSLEHKINLLILSAGTRNKIVQYFKKALTAEDGTRTGKVIATDMSTLAPAVYEADCFYQVPRITAEGYIDLILDLCRKEQISAVLSLIDPELNLLARNEELFQENGVVVIGSSYALCDLCLNKMKMFHWLSEHNYLTARSFTSRYEFFDAVSNSEINYPVFVKPVNGSASLSISLAKDKETVELLLDHDDGLMIQEYMQGQEIGADVYIDMISGEVVSIFTKKKLVMRAGETDKAVSFKDPALFELIEKFVKEAGFRGQIDIDIFEINGKYYISEVNPRFGGGYPHAYECGCDHMQMIVNNLMGIVNTCKIGAYEEGIYMMKYCEIMIKGNQ